MKIFNKKYLVLLCALMLLFAVLLTACGDDTEEEPNDSQQEEPTGDPTGDPTEDSGSEDSGSEDSGLPQGPTQTINMKQYKIVYDDKASAAVTEMVANFWDEITGYLDYEVEFLWDKDVSDKTSKAILIGLSDFPATETSFAKIGDKFTYNISIINDQICVQAATPELLQVALDLLVDEYISKSEGNGKFELPENMDYTPAEMKHLTFIERGNCFYNVVYPRSVTAGTPMSLAAIEILQYLQAHTNEEQEVELFQDFPTGEGGTFDLTQASVVIGNTLYPRSAEFSKDMVYFKWHMEFLDNQYYLFCNDTASSTVMKQKLLTKLNNGTYFKDEKTIRILVPEAESGLYADWCSEVPQYVPVAGEKITELPISEFSEGYFRLRVCGVTPEGAAAYNELLKANGYIEYQQRVSSYNYDSEPGSEPGVSTFTTYVGEKTVVHVYYLANQSKSQTALRVLVCSKDNFYFYDTKAEDLTTVAVTKPTMTITDMDYSKQSLNSEGNGQDNGLGLIFTLEDGSYVIFDGGYAHDTEKLYNYLVENNKNPTGRIKIRAWVLTHPHGDHYPAFVEFSKYGGQYSNVDLGTVIYQFDYEMAMNPNNSDSNDVQSVELAKILTRVKHAAGAHIGCQVVVPMAGQVMYFGTLKLEILATSEMLYKADGTATSNQNDHSLITRVTLGGDTVLITGDTATPSYHMLTIETVFGDELKSNIMTAPHHGLNGSDSLYKLVQPSYVIFHTNEKHYYRRLDPEDTQSKANGVLMDQRKLAEDDPNRWLKEVLYAEGGSKNGYRELLLPFMGSDYYETDLEQGGNYGDGPLDGDDWNDIPKQNAVLPKKES